MRIISLASPLILLLSLSFTSCIRFENKNEDTDSEAIDTVSITDSVNHRTMVHKPAENIPSAIYTYNDTLGRPIKRNELPAGAASAVQLLDVINKYNGMGKVVLKYVKTSNDTVFVRLDDSEYLTQQMGTLGAHAYLATATYTLTELPEIKYINFDFDEGDHASPGTYSRADFNKQ